MKTKEKHPQVNQRRHQYFFDQHGRKYSASIDIRTGAPSSAITPCFSAPWIPPLHHPYIKTGHDPENVQALFIDYDRAIADRELRLTEWTEYLIRVGNQMQGDAFNPDHPSQSVLLRAGPKPESTRRWLAAQAGDPWILGFSDAMPAWAVSEFVPQQANKLAFMQATDAPTVKINKQGRPYDAKTGKMLATAGA